MIPVAEIGYVRRSEFRLEGHLDMAAGMERVLREGKRDYAARLTEMNAIETDPERRKARESALARLGNRS